MAPVTETQEITPWFVVAVVFIALFVIILFGSALLIGYLHHQRKLTKHVNPYPYGSANWLDWERAASPRSENDALAIANLEAQLVFQEQYNVEADKMIELLDNKQKELTLQLRDERRKGEHMDPEVYQRIYDEIHKPLSPVRSSLPPLIVKSTHASSSWSSTTLAPQDHELTPVLLQTTKLRDIMRSNSIASPKRSVQLVQAKHLPSSGTAIDLAENDTGYADDSRPAIGKKPQHYQI